MKKTFAFFLLFILISFSLQAFAPKFGINLRGGYSMINPAEFNTDYTGIFQNGYGLVDTVTGTPLDGMALGSISLNWFPADTFALFFRSDFLQIDNTDLLTPEGTEKEVINSHISLTTGYFGLGGKVYATLSDTFLPYLSLDGGMFMQYSSFWEVWADPANTVGIDVDTTAKQYSLVNITDMGFGGHVELGFDILFFGSWGINAGAGYRYGTIPVTYPIGTIMGDNPDLFKAKSIDISGLYFGGGLSFYFGMDPYQNVGGLSANVNQATKFEQYGDSYYAKKNYAYALNYYMSVMKFDQQNPNIYKKIGYTHYMMGQKEKAFSYLDQYMKMKPTDTNVSSWLLKVRGK